MIVYYPSHPEFRRSCHKPLVTDPGRIMFSRQARDRLEADHYLCAMNRYSAGPENLEGMESNVIDRIHDLVARVIMNSTYIVRKKACE